MYHTHVNYAQTCDVLSTFVISGASDEIRVRLNYSEATHLSSHIQSYPSNAIPKHIRFTDGSGKIRVLSQEMMISLYAALIEYQIEFDVGHLLADNTLMI